MSERGAPELSIVVTIVDGGDALRRLLDALRRQQNAPRLQVLVAYDETIAGVSALSSEYPEAEFIAMGEVAMERPASSAAGLHELYDRRRSAALRRATAPLIGILEDRVRPRPDWAATMVRLHRELPHGVIGGAIESAAGDLLNWAFWAVDYSRYALPFEAGPRQWVSDVNVCYKRRSLDATRAIWEERYNEAGVHWTLLERGEVLYLTPEAVVDFHTAYESLGSLLPERFHWGRLFGSVRVAEASIVERAKLVASGPLVPLVLLFRHAGVQQRIGNTGKFMRASPYVFPLLVAWASGEVWGYVSRRA
ncbi:MAG: hypothetical protein ACT4P7_10735 [Gemmatimonadaceae bacterium]